VYTTKPDLDRIDLRLLELLTQDARTSNKELAAAVGLAPSSCHARVQRLVATGVLRGFHADVDLKLLGYGLQAMISVRLVRQTANIEALTERLTASADVLQVYHVSGSEDLLIHVAASDTDHLGAILKEDLFAANEVRHVETSVIFEHARSTRLPTAG
jgi:DNA-binding Lrp family transcriptional regulator